MYDREGGKSYRALRGDLDLDGVRRLLCNAVPARRFGERERDGGLLRAIGDLDLEYRLEVCWRPNEGERDRERELARFCLPKSSPILVCWGLLRMSVLINDVHFSSMHPCRQCL